MDGGQDREKAGPHQHEQEDVRPHHREEASERDEAVAKLAAYERKMDAEKVASAMIQKGLTAEPFDRVMEQMVKAAEQGELEKISAAVELSGPDMGEKVARMVEGAPSGVASDASEHDFIRFIVGDVG